MAEAIASELVNFKTKVSSSLSSMESTLSTLVSKIAELTNINTSTQSSISYVYSSENKDAVLEKFTKINTIYNKVTTSLESDLKNILTNSSLLIEKITKLETLKAEIEQQEAKIKSAGSAMSYNSDMSNKKEVDSHNSARQKIINEANAIISSKTSEFNTLHEEAKSDLNKLKSADSTLSFVTEFQPIDISLLSQYFTGSSFEKFTYKASNGKTVEFYLYVPEYSKEVTNLPVHIYLHGAGEFGSGVLNQSLPKMLKEGLDVNGIVICPQGKEDTYWNDNDYQDALIEATNSVVTQYNADASRISLSGHSQGAIGGYRLVSRNPGYFSAFMPIAGHSGKMENTTEGWQAVSDVKIWSFHGTDDSAVKYSGSTSVMEKLESMGSDNMELYTFQGGGHSIQNKVFSGQFEYNGETYNPLEWAFTQTVNDD